MRSAGNFHPEWGYLAPTPSFARTLRIALVATAVGATAGAGVVVSLVPHHAAGGGTDDSIAAHALVTSVPAASSAAAVAPAQPAQTAAPPAQTAAVSAQPAAASAQQAIPAGEIGAAGSVGANAAAPPQGVGTPDAANGAAPAQVAHQVAHVDEPAAAAPNHDDTVQLPEAAPSKKKKHRVSGYESIRRWQASREAKKPRYGQGGFEPLFRLFSSRTGLFSAN
jgi:hypothetical protein